MGEDEVRYENRKIKTEWDSLHNDGGGVTMAV